MNQLISILIQKEFNLRLCFTYMSLILSLLNTSPGFKIRHSLLFLHLSHLMIYVQNLTDNALSCHRVTTFLGFYGIPVCLLTIMGDM